MTPIDLQIRCYNDSTEPPVPCREEFFLPRNLTFPIPLEPTALVLVDLWNMHHIQSWP